jgi:hypothetical protein
MAIFLSQGTGKSEEHGTGERLFSLVICKRSEPLFKQIGAVQTSIQVVQFIVQNLQHCNSLDYRFHASRPAGRIWDVSVTGSG